MPQLIRGGKWVYGWSVVGMDCRIPIPEEAKEEYGLSSGAGVIVMSGSRSSRGFAFIVKGRLVQEAKKYPELRIYEAMKLQSRPMSSTCPAW